MKFRNKKGENRIIDGREGEFLSFDGKTAVYKHKEMLVNVMVEQNGNRLLWRICVENKTADLLEWVELMSYGVCSKLRDEKEGRGSIITTYNEGAEVTNMAQRENTQFSYIEPDFPSMGRYYVFPYKVSSQFTAYLLNGKGIYMGMHDEERTPKHIDFQYVNNAIKMQMRVFCNVNYGENYEMPFDSVLQCFDGGWEDACEIYRAWFKNHLPQAVKKIEENTDLPAWYHESPIVVTYPVRGKHDQDEMEPNGMYPYKNAIPFLQEVASNTDSKVMSLLMHWEGTAPWAPPYVWPPYGGVEVFNDFISEMHKQDMLVGVYGSGIAWTQISRILPGYSREQDFIDNNFARLMCSDINGHMECGVCREQKTGYDLCSIHEDTKALVENEWAQVCNSNVDYAQAFDQNHGGCSYFCYSDKHGHVPAPGKWQVEESFDLIERVKSHGKNTLFGCETATAEPFLGLLQLSDNRYELNYYIGLPIPVYAYIYHEYINNFMGNQVGMNLSKEEYNYPYRLAYSFLAGDFLTIVMTDEGEISYAWGGDCFKYHTNKEVAYKMLKNLNEWRRKAAKDFLHMGKMVKAMAIPCGKNSFWHIKNENVLVDKLLTSAFEYNGRILQFVVNYNSEPLSVVLPEFVTVYTNADMTECIDDVKVFEIPAYTVYAFERNK